MSKGNVADLASLPFADQLAWIGICRAQLLKKQARERAYLDRRAARGTHTPTDDAFEADAILESALLEALALLEAVLQNNASSSVCLFGSNGLSVDDLSMAFPALDPHGKLQP